MAQQTAVDWLKEKLVNMYNDNDMMHPIRVLELLKQAKVIEKEQSKRDYYAGLEGYIVNDGGFEGYYNETYNK